MKSPETRKTESETLLKQWDIPINPHLPLIEDEQETRLRSPHEVAQRAIILFGIMAAGHGEDRAIVIEWLKDHQLWDAVSPAEKDFLKTRKPSQQKRIDATWRAEALWVLLWSLGHVESLNKPVDLCDVEFIQNTIPFDNDKCKAFIESATLRPTPEILDALDLAYRIHWAVRDAQLNNNDIPGDFNPGIAQERHYTLNWLTVYEDNWDDISTDT